MAEQQEQIFTALINVIQEQERLLASIADKLSRIESIGGGGGSASIEDYESGKVYKRNTLLVDRNTETVYRSLAEPNYTSVTVETDLANRNLKLVGFESQIIAFNGDPTQAQLNVIPDDTLVAIYSAADTPYQPSSFE